MGEAPARERRYHRTTRTDRKEHLMIEGVQIVSVPVSDQERAKSFYLDALGFELRQDVGWGDGMRWVEVAPANSPTSDRKSTRLNSSHANISYAVFCLKKKNKNISTRGIQNATFHRA